MTDPHQRENAEPTEKNRAIPLSMWVVIGILTVWGVGFYAMNTDEALLGQTELAAQSSVDTQENTAPEQALSTMEVDAKTESAVTETAGTEVAKTEAVDTTSGSADTASSELKAADGQAIYASQCLACHQAGGMGIPGVFPPLKDAEWVKGDPHVLTGIILAGYTGALDVLGQTYNGAMPRFAEQLNDAEAAAVVSYLRTTLNSEAPVDAALVADVRAKIPAGPYTNTDDLNGLAQP